jgi:uncharacterized protein (TIGR04255 family)
MIRRILKNKPLAEAIFELRWNLQDQTPGMKIDPHYKLLIGRLYDKVSEQYPFHERLPAASIPDDMAGYIVQHRFRKGEDEWPLVQIGPGIITVNDTEGYVWEDFEKRIVEAINVLFEIYPESKDSLKVNSVLLRYIDAVAFDYESDDIFAFLEEQMKTKIGLHGKLFDGTKVEKVPSGLDLRFSFASTEPKGAIYLRFGRGRARESDALLWETMVQCTSEEAPKVPNEIVDWIRKAHNLTDDWFFKLIEGELLRRFE